MVETSSPRIRRVWSVKRWSDLVVHNGVAKWVEVSATPGADFAIQVQEVLTQIDESLALIGSDRTALLEVLIFVTDLAKVAELNELWDAWIIEGHAPIRACVQVGIAKGYSVEMIVTAAENTKRL